jgi:hypothetical protein
MALRVVGGIRSHGEPLGDEVANVEADQLPAVSTGGGYVGGVISREAVL